MAAKTQQQPKTKWNVIAKTRSGQDVVVCLVQTNSETDAIAQADRFCRMMDIDTFRVEQWAFPPFRS